MSVCIAWIKNNKGYMIADSLTSSRKNITLSPQTAFLQDKAPIDGYYFEEEGLKIYEISKEFSIAFAGDVPSYSELLHWIYSLKDSVSVNGLINLLKINYMHLLEKVEIIFLYNESGNVKLRIINNKKDYVPTDTSMPIFIGSGSKNLKFVEAVKKAIVSNQDHNPHQYLALVIAYVQCLSMKLKTIRYGFGGTFYGLFLSSKIHWMRDMEYVLLAQNGSVSQSISIIIRKSSVIISSSMENNSRVLVNCYTSNEWFAEYHNMKSVIKASDTKEAFYYIYYGIKSNRIYLWEAKGILVRSDFRKWIRRGEKKTDYLYAIDPRISDLITSGKSKVLEPQGHILSTVGSFYLPLDASAIEVINETKKINIHTGYDFDFIILDCTTFNKNHIKLIRKDLDKFYNIVVIDYEFFYQKILQENLAFYNDYEFDLTQMHLELLLRHCLQNDYYVEYSKIKIVVLKGSNNHTINGLNLTSWFESYHNCTFIETNNIEKDLSELLIYWIKEYYINENYFHLGMNVLIADNQYLGPILDTLIPLGRRDGNAADWILVRLNNDETSMPGGFNYVNEEWAFLDLLNVDVGYELQQKVAITEREQELLSGNGKNVIHDWTENTSLFNTVKLIDPTN